VPYDPPPLAWDCKSCEALEAENERLQRQYDGAMAEQLRLDAEIEQLRTEREQCASLIEAVWQVLDDMGEDGTCCCTAAKAELRLAYEPFKHEDYKGWMSVEAATIIKEGQ
jgi:hypothetical protein